MGNMERERNRSGEGETRGKLQSFSKLKMASGFKLQKNEKRNANSNPERVKKAIQTPVKARSQFCSVGNRSRRGGGRRSQPTQRVKFRAEGP